MQQKELGLRTIVLAGPARVAAEVDVPFDTPRAVDALLADPRYAPLRATLRGHLQQRT